MPLASLLASLIVCIAFAAVPLESRAQEPGEYITPGGSGRVVIGRAGDGATTFQLWSDGPNGHTCSLKGEIFAGLARVSPGFGTTICVVKFARTVRGVEVEPITQAECRGFCGMRAAFGGDHWAVPRACRQSVRTNTKNQALVSYRQKRYGQAADAWSALLSRCAPTLSQEEAAFIRNDLASTYFHLGKRSACLAVLKPLIDELTRMELDFMRETRPVDHMTWLAISQQAQHNDALCRSIQRV